MPLLPSPATPTTPDAGTREGPAGDSSSRSSHLRWRQVWEARYAALCREARLTEPQARCYRLFLAGLTVEETRETIFGPLSLPATRRQRKHYWRARRRQLRAVSLSVLQATKRIQAYVGELSRDAEDDFRRDLVAGHRNRMSDWAAEPALLLGEEMASERDRLPGVRMICPGDVPRGSVGDRVDLYVRSLASETECRERARLV